LIQRFRALANALVTHQIVGGGWRNLIDEPSSYPESSTTAMVVAGITQAVDAGLLPQGYLAATDTAWSAIEHRVDPSGQVAGVSYRPGVNNDLARYEHTPIFGSYPWGQGAYLLAGSRRLQPNQDGTN